MSNRNFQILPPLDFLAEFTQHIPPKGSHLIRGHRPKVGRGWYSNKSRGMRKKVSACIAAEISLCDNFSGASESCPWIDGEVNRDIATSSGSVVLSRWFIVLSLTEVRTIRHANPRRAPVMRKRRRARSGLHTRPSLALASLPCRLSEIKITNSKRWLYLLLEDRWQMGE